MMRLYLMRHGVAASGAAYDFDGDRPLTTGGRAAVRQIAKRWQEEGSPAPLRWLISPFVRAAQTAEICAGVFGTDAPVEVSRDLLPEARVSSAADRIVAEGAEVLAVVAHQPLLGGLAAYLLGWPSVPAHLQPGAMLAIDLPSDGPGTLLYHLMPPTAERGPLLLLPEEG